MAGEAVPRDAALDCQVDRTSATASKEIGRCVMSKLWWGNDYKQLLADCEARLSAALAENARLRDENEKLRATPRRPPVVMIGMGKDDEGGEVSYMQSDCGGW